MSVATLQRTRLMNRLHRTRHAGESCRISTEWGRNLRRAVGIYTGARSSTVIAMTTRDAKEWERDRVARYELIEEAHGEGGFGEVRKHRDIVLERVVAVKRLKLINDKEAKERFRREARAL